LSVVLLDLRLKTLGFIRALRDLPTAFPRTY